MRLFIVIPVFNRKAFTRACLEALQKQTFQGHEVIVVDDGSTDGTDQMIKEEFPSVHLLRGDGNLWWTGGVNMGIRYARELGLDYCMTLNNDTLLPDEYLANMVNWAEQKPEAVMGSLEKDPNTEAILYGGEYFDEHKTTYWLDVLSEKEQKGLHPVTSLPGRGLWIPETVFKKIGIFDQKRFPHYYADFDFTYNAYRAGFEVHMNYDAYLYAYPEESGKADNLRIKNLKGYYNHLFSMRGAANLKDFTNYTLKNCPPKLVPVRLAEGYARRLLGYWIK